jgi:hypothetical protein
MYNYDINGIKGKMGKLANYIMDVKIKFIKSLFIGEFLIVTYKEVYF